MTLPQLIARPLLAGMFVYGGQDSFRNGDAKAEKAATVVGPLTSATGLDAAQLVTINGAVQVVAGVALAFGVFPRPAAAVLALSVVPTTLAGHRFWEERGPARNAQTIQFLKNAAMLGGLVLAATSTGGRPSVPWRAKRALRHVVEGSSDKLGELGPADVAADDDVFDDPSRWRVAAVRALGLGGEDRIAGVVTGAAYPDALAAIVDALDGVTGMVCDIGGGLGGAAQWMATRRRTGPGARRMGVVVEPEAASVRAAAELFPGLAVVQGEATALPIAHDRCAAVTLLGVVSLVDDLDDVLAEVARVLAPGGVVGITDLCAVGQDRLTPDGSANVFRRADVLIAALAALGIRTTDRWTAPADLRTPWDDVRDRVDDEIGRRFAAEPAYEAWVDDRRQIHEQITSGSLVVETIVGRTSA